MNEPVTGMAALISTLQTIMTAIFTGVGNVCSTIMAEGNELLLLTVGFLFAGGVLGIFSRFLSRN